MVTIWTIFFRRILHPPTTFIILQNLASFSRLDRATEHCESCHFYYGHPCICKSCLQGKLTRASQLINYFVVTHNNHYKLKKFIIIFKNKLFQVKPKVFNRKICYNRHKSESTLKSKLVTINNRIIHWLKFKISNLTCKINASIPCHQNTLFGWHKHTIFNYITRLPLDNGSIVFGQNFRCRVFTWFLYFEVQWAQKGVFAN